MSAIMSQPQCVNDFLCGEYVDKGELRALVPEAGIWGMEK